MVRVGIGWDVHPRVEGRDLNLGGVLFEDAKKGLAGHSDADVVCHAVCDALLGALALGDIGEHFPDSDPAFKDMPGIMFLDAVLNLIATEGFAVTNVDCTVMCDTVRLGERKIEMAAIIAEHLRIDSGQVSVKATTWEGFGSIGRGEVIACQAVAMVAEAL
jgi:2-C-methyl-D-erythritol 2,4-cyclodiphosphate synthase